MPITPPTSGPTMGIQKYPENQGPLPGIASSPQPPAQASSRGPRSRAGLMAYPALAPKDIPIAATEKPMINGPRFARTAVLRMSTTAAIASSSSPVPTTWSKNGPHQPPLKYGAGKVEKMDKVGMVWPVSANVSIWESNVWIESV